MGFENEMLALLFAREILERCANEKEAPLDSDIRSKGPRQERRVNRDGDPRAQSPPSLAK